MLENLLTILTRLFIGIVAIGLAVALFFIGIIALWYFLLIGSVVWLGRKLYFAWKGRHQEPGSQPASQQKATGRIIDHE